MVGLRYGCLEYVVIVALNAADIVETSDSSVDTWPLDSLLRYCVTPGIWKNILFLFVGFSVALTKYLTKSTYQGRKGSFWPAVLWAGRMLSVGAERHQKRKAPGHNTVVIRITN